MNNIPTFIFDLDGVITNTEDYHFDAWKSICFSLNYDLSAEKNEELKGVYVSEQVLIDQKMIDLDVLQIKLI